jgi:copper chaperone CopZ
MSVQTTYTVTGMTCGHCAHAVSGELSKLGGVVNVDVDVASGAVTVTSEGPLGERI